MRAEVRTVEINTENIIENRQFGLVNFYESREVLLKCENWTLGKSKNYKKCKLTGIGLNTKEIMTSEFPEIEIARKRDRFVLVEVASWWGPVKENIRVTLYTHLDKFCEDTFFIKKIQLASW